MPNPDRYELPVYDPETGECLSDENNRKVALHHEDTSIRVILDEDPHGPNDGFEPNLLIERHAKKWLIVVHPDGGDPVCGIEIHDDGLVEVQDCGGALLHSERRH